MHKREILYEYAKENGWSPRRDEPMSRYTTFKIGGPADLILEIPGEMDLCRIIRKCRSLAVPYQVIGKGSNLLVSDRGMEGCVLLLTGELAGVEAVGDGKIRCGAGTSLARLCSFALTEELSGLEFSWGIPGSAGGAAFMNAGAYGGEMKDVLLSCRHVTPEGEIGELSGEALALGYRRSVYAENVCVITQITVQLKKDSAAEIRGRMEDYMQRRKSKQPLEYPSAGSVFKRPPGKFAGALIENSGLKGYAVGGAKVSEKHAGFIVNTGGATCREVQALIAHIQKTVEEREDVRLECEVKKIGRE